MPSRTRRMRTKKRRKYVRKIRTIIKKKHKKGGMLQAHKRQTLSTAQALLSTIHNYTDPDKGKLVLFKKTPSDLIIWSETMTYERGLQENMYKDDTILGTGKLSQKYIDKYRPISDIWGYNSEPYINYELLTHADYKEHSLRQFQHISDPLMRNLQRLSEGQALLPYDTTELLSQAYGTIDILEKDKDADYVNWFCKTVLPHFIRQSNVSTLLYELADQRWRSSLVDFNDENVLLFLSLVTRLFLLLAVKEWDKMRKLLKYVSI
jgi:hypothetical protein